MLDKLTETIKTSGGSNTDFWLTNESCNKLIKEAESVRLTERGCFELKFDSGYAIGLETKEILVYGEKPDTAYAKLMYVNDVFTAVAGAKNCEIL